MFYRQAFHAISKFKVSLVIKVLIASDFMVWASSNLLAPIFAIFITETIEGASLETIGFAASIYFIVKAICEIPAGILIDKNRHRKFDLYFTVLGTVMTGLIYFSYNYITTVPMLFLAQASLGLSAAICYPGWYSMFTSHIDKDKQAFEWSLYDVSMGFGIAVASAIGAIMVDTWGFGILFNTLGVFTLAGAVLLLSIKGKLKTNASK